MDLTSLTRPAILGQCLRCSSSLAVLENEWAKLSNSYSFVTAWLSLDLHRISISLDRKQIPDTSEMSLLRGRIIQEASCKLCQQKLGVVCTMDNGLNFLWKLSRVSFREIVTMRTAEPIYKEGALERYFQPQESSIQRPGQNNILAPASTDHYTQQQMQHQGRSIDQISYSVHHLQDTMADLKNSFTSLRIELNGSNRNLGDSGIPGFDMVATVLKELKSKSEEIEKLTLEIEALKLKNRFMEDRKKSTLEYQPTHAPALPEVHSPGLLQVGRKRTWPDAFPTHGRTIADSFADDDLGDDLALEDSLNFAAQITNNTPLERAASPQYRIEYNTTNATESNRVASNAHPIEIPNKRQRLAQEEDGLHEPETPPPDSRIRKRKSMTQVKRSYTTKDSRPATSSSNAPVDSNPTTQIPLTDVTSSDHPVKRRRGRPSLRSKSVGPTEYRVNAVETQTSNNTTENAAHPETNGQELSKGTANGGDSTVVVANGANGVNKVEVSAEDQRKAKVAARDHLTKLAMQREEAMETDGS
ncbi:hypothetical protein N7495_004822 [Penicillium taxi]|uniref:uncharacterized protein n=1 Tax=Penicillium taxi TaxID=168475 RepID=UPI0025456697|nr:uncharacterized protein N7495_004822 [Penicillium taxi]KAJ5900078.1 hypothetical protein N7495_004822 [Penicillium taxi]